MMSHRRFLFTCVVAFLAGLAAVGAYDVLQQREIAARQRIVKEKWAAVQRMRPIIDDVDAYARDKDVLLDRIDVINHIKQTQSDWHAELAILERLAAQPEIRVDSAEVGKTIEIYLHAASSEPIERAAAALRDVAVFDHQLSEPACSGTCVDAIWRVRRK